MSYFIKIIVNAYKIFYQFSVVNELVYSIYFIKRQKLKVYVGAYIVGTIRITKTRALILCGPS